jgi:hypothetical protein
LILLDLCALRMCHNACDSETFSHYMDTWERKFLHYNVISLESCSIAGKCSHDGNLDKEKQISHVLSFPMKMMHVFLYDFVKIKTKSLIR